MFCKTYSNLILEITQDLTQILHFVSKLIYRFQILEMHQDVISILGKLKKSGGDLENVQRQFYSDDFRFNKSLSARNVENRQCDT